MHLSNGGHVKAEVLRLNAVRIRVRIPAGFVSKLEMSEEETEALIKDLQTSLDKIRNQDEKSLLDNDRSP